jgi:large subunit ribosomal protein L15
LIAENRLSGAITPETLYAAGAISKKTQPVKILGNGEITTAVTISAHGFSETAKQKIEKAGGTANIHG